MLRHLKARLTYANVAATLALFIALGAGIAYAADGGGSCDNIKPRDIAAPIQSGKIPALQFVRSNGSASHEARIEVAGPGRMVIRMASVRFREGDGEARYELTAKSEGDEQTAEAYLPEADPGAPTGAGAPVELSLPVKRGTYEIKISTYVNASGPVLLEQVGDWTYQILPEA